MEHTSIITISKVDFLLRGAQGGANVNSVAIDDSYIISLIGHSDYLVDPAFNRGYIDGYANRGFIGSVVTVVCIEHKSSRVMGVTTSDTTGYYRFDNLDTKRLYTIVAYSTEIPDRGTTTTAVYPSPY